MKTSIRSRITQTVIALGLVIGLVCGASVPTMAKDDNQNGNGTDRGIQMTIIKGKVAKITTATDGSGVSFDVTKKDASTVTVNVDSNTKYYKVEAGPYVTGVMDKVQRGLGNKNGQTESATTNDDEVNSAIVNPELEQGLNRNSQGPQGILDRVRSWFGGWHGFGKDAVFNDIEVGDGVIVSVMPNETLAKQVLIIKPSNIKQISGKIGSVGTNTFTVTPTDTKVAAVILTIDENTSVMIKGAIGITNGQWATVVYKAQSNGNLAITVKVTLKEPTSMTSATTAT